MQDCILDFLDGGRKVRDPVSGIAVEGDHHHIGEEFRDVFVIAEHEEFIVDPGKEVLGEPAHGAGRPQNGVHNAALVERN